MTVWLAGGGTGGHVFPMVSLAEMLTTANVPFSLVCLADRIDRELLKETGFAVQYENLPRPGGSWGSRLRFLPSLVRTTIGWVFRLRRSDHIVSSGGYGSLPILLAARIRGVPAILYEPNAIDGKTIRLLTRLAPARIVRPMLDASPPLIRQALYPDHVPQRSRLLVLGGSQGSQSLNRLMILIWRKLLEENRYTGIDWITGTAGFAEVRDAVGSLPEVCVMKFCRSMQTLYSQARVAVARSGASSIFELALWEIPAIYVPLPWAADNHQRLNARQGVARGWGTLCEESAGPDALLQCLQSMADKLATEYTLSKWEESQNFWLHEVAA